MAAAKEPIEQTAAQKFTFGDANQTPWEKVQAGYNARKAEGEAAAAQQANAQQQVAGYNEQTAAQKRMKDLLAKMLRGGGSQNAVSQYPKLG
jgi:hypothetical protein